MIATLATKPTAKLNEILRQRLRILRERQGHGAVTALAAEARVSRVTMSGFLAGKIVFTRLHHLEAVAEILDAELAIVPLGHTEVIKT